MDPFLKMDIFFFVTTVVALVLGVLLAYVLWRLQRILKHIEHISEQAAHESDAIRADLAGLRSDLKEGKGKLKSLVSFVTKFAKRSSKKP